MKVTAHHRVLFVVGMVCVLALGAEAQENQHREEVPVPLENLVPPLPSPAPRGDRENASERPPIPRGLSVLQQLGVSLMPGTTGSLQVRLVQKGSLADQAGLQPRDQIVAVDNAPVASLADIPAQPPRMLTVQRGTSQRTLKIPSNHPVAPKPDRPTFTSRQYSFRRSASPTYSSTPTNQVHGYNHFRYSGNTDVGPNMTMDIGVDANGYPLYPFLWGFGPPYYYGQPPFYGKHYRGSADTPHPYRGSADTPHPYRGGRGGAQYRGGPRGIHHQRGGR